MPQNGRYPLNGGGGVTVKRLKKFMVYSLSLMSFFYPIPNQLSIKKAPGQELLFYFLDGTNASACSVNFCVNSGNV